LAGIPEGSQRFALQHVLMNDHTRARVSLKSGHLYLNLWAEFSSLHSLRSHRTNAPPPVGRLGREGGLKTLTMLALLDLLDRGQ